VLEVSRERPVLQTQARTQTVEVAVELECEFVQPVAHMGQPFGALDHTIEEVAMHHPQTLPGGGHMHRFFLHLHTAKGMPDKCTGKFIVVARHVDHATTFAGASQQLLHHIVVALRPEPAPAQLPAVHDIAHQVQDLARMVLEEILQGVGLKARCTDVQIGNENRAVAWRFMRLLSGVCSLILLGRRIAQTVVQQTA